MGGILGIGASSPWISAKQFNNFWSSRVTTETYSGQYILQNPQTIFSRPFYKGDIIQALNSSGEAWHSLFITDYSSEDFIVTYHSNNTERKSFLAFVSQNPNAQYRFFTIN